MTASLVVDELLTVVLLAQVGLVLWNVRALRRPASSTPGAARLRVSVLVPARDEEHVIGRCVAALSAQDYQNLEIVVLDDGSHDRTAAIVRAVADERLDLVEGAPLPPGWTGKNWACHQLAARATGDVLCFVDADTILEPEAVSRAMSELTTNELGLVSMLVHTETGTVAEAVLMPMVTYAFLALIPSALVERPGARQVALALGPFVMVTREAYASVGGHAGAPGHLVDDVRLARAIKAAGYRIALRNGSRLVRTRWYAGFREIWQGFSKNAYGALDYQPIVALAAIVALTPLLVTPFVRLLVAVSAGGALTYPAVQVGLVLGTRTVTSRAGRDPLWSVPLHPVTILVWSCTLAHSMMLSRPGHEIRWKGRVYTATEEHAAT